MNWNSAEWEGEVGSSVSKYNGGFGINLDVKEGSPREVALDRDLKDEQELAW